MFVRDDKRGTRILVVDDDRQSLELFQGHLEKRGFSRVTVSESAARAWELFSDLRPHLVILDLVMPVNDGFWFLERMRFSFPDLFVPVIVISGNTDPQVKSRALLLGARDFITKPFEMIEVTARIDNMLELKLIYDRLQDQNRNLESVVNKRTEQLQKSFRDALNSLSAAMEYHNRETGLHLRRMREFTRILASDLGLPKERAEALADASIMHDIGKIGIPDSILLKDGPLTPEEWEVMKEHTIIGADILTGYNSDLMVTASSIALSHHEKWNGQGYPRGLAEKAIPLEGQIVSLCDTYDALISWRSYKKAWSHEAAVECISFEKGRSFDPCLVELFLEHQSKFLEASLSVV